MSQQELQIFDNNNIRSYWDEEKEQWFFCINDVIQALTDSRDVKQYIKRLRQREPELNSVWGTICTPPPFSLIRWQASFRKLHQYCWHPSHCDVNSIT